MFHFITVLTGYALFFILETILIFLALSHLKALKNRGVKIPRLVDWCCKIAFPFGYIGDMEFNLLVGTYLFGEWPKERLFSWRIQRYMDQRSAPKNYSQAVVWALFLDASDPGHIDFDRASSP